MNFRQRLGENLLIKVISLIVAIIAWTAVQGERTYKSAVETPVEYILPPEHVLVADAPPPERVVLVASGTRAGLNKLRRASLKYLVDLESVGPGRVVHSFRAPPEGLPDDVSIATVSPAEIELAFDERMTDTFPVQLRTRGELPTGFVQTEVSLGPDRVRIVGARSELAELEQIRTLPFNLNGRKEDFDGEIGLDLSRLHVLPETARAVNLTYKLQEAVAPRSFGEVAIEVDESLAGVLIEPGSCAVRVEGPVPVLDAVSRRGLEVRLVGSLSPDAWDESGAQWVTWSTEAPQSGAALHVQVVHPRASEVKVLGVDPGRFKITAPPPAPPPEEGGETSVRESPPAPPGADPSAED